MIKKLNLNNAVFISSAASEKQFINSSLKGIAFAGKSNVGKSSVINSILNRKNLAKTGSQPGKTVHVNYFKIDDRVYFIDLPGYGYAKHKGYPTKAHFEAVKKLGPSPIQRNSFAKDKQ